MVAQNAHQPCSLVESEWSKKKPTGKPPKEETKPHRTKGNKPTENPKKNRQTNEPPNNQSQREKNDKPDDQPPKNTNQTGDSATDVANAHRRYRLDRKPARNYQRQ